MFEAGFAELEVPAPGDVMVGVCGESVRFGASGLADAHVIGWLDGVRVWAGTLPGGTDAQPWPSAEPVEVAARAVYSVQWRRTHRFCGECAGPLEDSPGYPTRRCPRCATRPYVAQALTPAVLVSITSGDRLLMVRHSYGIAAARWSLVAGMVEACEALETTVRREVREEVGLEIMKMAYVQSRGYSIDSPACLMLCFTAEVAADAQPRVDGVELVEARWFTRAEYAQLPPESVPSPYSLARPMIDAWRMSV
jgi:NAD+ diphosphatase